MSKTTFSEANILLFEDFLQNLGFKRIEGAIYGLLVLSDSPLTSVQIQEILRVSQSAVSNAVKMLQNYGAVIPKMCKDSKAKAFTCNDDCMNIVAQVLRRREQNYLREYKSSIKKLRDKTIKNGAHENSTQIERLDSILATSELGDVVIKFILALDELEGRNKAFVGQLTSRLNQVFNFILSDREIFSIKNKVETKIRSIFKKPSGEINEYN